MMFVAVPATQADKYATETWHRQQRAWEVPPGTLPQSFSLALDARFEIAVAFKTNSL